MRLGLVLESWLVFLTIRKVIERYRTGVDLDGLNIKVSLFTIIARDK